MKCFYFVILRYYKVSSMVQVFWLITYLRCCFNISYYDQAIAPV